MINSLVFLVSLTALTPNQETRLPITNLDLSAETQRQVLVDREVGQYLGHPTTVLLEDGKTMLCVYPKGHGKGGLVYKEARMLA